MDATTDILATSDAEASTYGSPTTSLEGGERGRSGAAYDLYSRFVQPVWLSEQPRSPWQGDSAVLREHLARPLLTRKRVSYQREFVDNYIPNYSSLLPASLAEELMSLGTMKGQQPAGTYARKVLEPLLIDLSWSSSRLEGNSYTLPGTKELFESRRRGDDLDSIMLLNHKDAIEFLVESVPMHGLTTMLARNLHHVLMDGLLENTAALGCIRQQVVSISHSTYVPTHIPSLLEEMFEHIVAKAGAIKNPVEAAFFLLVNIAYLQAFEDGSKRTSRLAANIPLMLYNAAPLSFLEVDANEYALAMIGVYECRDVSLAVELFEDAYRRSIGKYSAALKSWRPDPVRERFREDLKFAVRSVVADARTFDQAVDALKLSPEDAALFRPMFAEAIHMLDVYKATRYWLRSVDVERWINAGRPQ